MIFSQIQNKTCQSLLLFHVKNFTISEKKKKKKVKYVKLKMKSVNGNSIDLNYFFSHLKKCFYFNNKFLKPNIFKNSQSKE